VVELQFSGAVPANWAAGGLARDTTTLPAHSLFWINQHPDSTALAPLGFAGQLFPFGGVDETPVGEAKAGFQLSKS
jgi:hypothetical protein